MSLCLLVFLLSLFAGCEGQDFSTPAPDYDYNSTFYYSFYSNASNDELEDFLNSSDSFDPHDFEDEETVTTETPTETPLATTPRGRVRGAASLPVCADVRTLLWTLTVMILNAPQIQPL